MLDQNLINNEHDERNYDNIDKFGINVKYSDYMRSYMKLNEDQRSKLINREKLDNEFTIEKRRENEFAIRNRLKSFLEFIPDANRILYNLPKDQLTKNEKLKDVLNDETVYGLFDLILQLLNLLDFAQASGNPKKPYVVKWGDYKGPLIDRYAPPIQREEPFDFEKELAKINAQKEKIDYSRSSHNTSSPVVKRMTYREHRRNKYINIYIRDLIEHYQSDPILHVKINHEWREHAREGKPTNLDDVKTRIITAIESAGIAPKEYRPYINVSEKE
jgi:hypothetical protein